jgi:hypothetical protein
MVIYKLIAVYSFDYISGDTLHDYSSDLRGRHQS